MPSILALVLAAAASAAPPGGELPVADGRVEVQKVSLKSGERIKLPAEKPPLVYVLDKCKLTLKTEGKSSDYESAGRQALVVTPGGASTLTASTEGDSRCELLLISTPHVDPRGEPQGNAPAPAAKP